MSPSGLPGDISSCIDFGSPAAGSGPSADAFRCRRQRKAPRPHSAQLCEARSSHAHHAIETLPGAPGRVRAGASRTGPGGRPCAGPGTGRQSEYQTVCAAHAKPRAQHAAPAQPRPPHLPQPSTQAPAPGAVGAGVPSAAKSAGARAGAAPVLGSGGLVAGAGDAPGPFLQCQATCAPLAVRAPLPFITCSISPLPLR
mmetsp:Transcript_15289/g.44752  ORF Transcript_15289/g.44752 Transcript_15289/m.44752 type:complete len:198 (-) Transcript_15289:505-1098(-)